MFTIPSTRVRLNVTKPRNVKKLIIEKNLDTFLFVTAEIQNNIIIARIIIPPINK